jgi:hypothetical protein
MVKHSEEMEYEQEAVLVGLFQSSRGMMIESAYILPSVVAAKIFLPKNITS